MGNYKSFGDTKFIVFIIFILYNKIFKKPRISKEKFELILQCSSNLGKKN